MQTPNALILVLSALAVREIASQCNPTPCGVNTNCQVSGTGVAVCRCQAGWDHAPGRNTIDGCPIRTGGGSNFRGGSSSSNNLFSRPRSPPRSSGSTFHQNRLGGGNVATRIEGVDDPCYPDPCGINTKCTSAGNRAVCACIPGFKGDPYSQCDPAPCDVARCGRNAECVEERGRAICRCPPGFRGRAEVSCDEDPCLGRNTCDANADCAVITSRNGFPSAQCTCRGEYEGDGHTRCYLDPCKRNPCGINAECQANGEDYRCECPRGYSGNARSRCNPDPCSEGICGPNADCEARGASAQCSCRRGYVGDPASRQGCRLEPCSQGVCGTGAECTSNGFNAICKCPRGWTGDPYTRCTADPCSLDPCGRNAICSNQGETHKCECPEDHVGSPYDVCTFDPCASNPCGANTACTVRGQRADCACNRGYVGEPFSRSGCRADPCSVADICGPGAECQNSNGRPTCHCLPRHVPNPDPYQGCVQGECVANEDCPSDQACADFRCVDPCAQSCGQGADCDVNNHVAICRCPRGRTGDPFRSCRSFTREEICEKCGANTDCRISDHDPLTPVCSCKSSYIGNPLTGCHRECERDNECSDQQKCEDFKCRAVCDQDACGEGANCRARSHRPDCTCPEFYQGDAYSRAGCRPECTRHNDCSDTEACVEFQCKDPCRYNNPCGSGADCKATGHKAICSCPRGFTGDPFVNCRKFERADLCSPNPCGPGAECTPGFDNNGNDKPVCTCPRGYRGDPLTSCNRGECDRDSDCPSDRGCYNFRCENPCNRRERGQGCGVSAECRVVRHAAVCACPSGTVGDPVVACRPARDGFRTKSVGNRFF